MNSLYFSPMLLGINVLIASTVACIALWWFSRPYRGPGVWTCGVSTLMLGLLLFIGYMANKNPLLNIIGTGLQLAGEALLVIGVFRFLDRPEPWWIVLFSVAAITPVMAWHSWVTPINSEFLVTLYSAISALLFGMVSRALWHEQSESELLGARRFVALTFAILALVTVLGGLLGLVNGLRGVEHTEELQSVSYLMPLNFGIPVWVVALIGLALLTMRRILRDSQHHALAAMHAAARFERLMNVSNAGVVLLEEDRIVDANPMMETLFARAHHTILGQSLISLFEPDDNLASQLKEADGRPYDRQAIRDGLSYFAAELSVASLEGGSQVAEIRDVSERKVLEEELRRLASRDPLTGALNRRSFAEHAAHELGRSKRQGNPICLAIFDLDHFKQINDRYGHAVGDQVLQRFALLCQEQLRRTDLFARFGGEEFVLLLNDTDQTHASTLLNLLREQWAAEMLHTPQGTLRSTVSIGLVQIDHQQPLEHWLERADTALYQAKNSGRNRLANG